jgi:hypothetical protein
MEPSWECDPCPSGEYNVLPGQMFCQSCPEGHEQSEDRTHCSPCPMDYYNDELRGSCKPCPKGSFTYYNEGNKVCNFKCDTDNGYAHVPGSNEVCSRCPIGYIPYIPKFGPPRCAKAKQRALSGLKDLTLF